MNIDPKNLSAQAREAVNTPQTTGALPLAQSLEYVITWLEGGCDPKEAAKELRLLQERAAPLEGKTGWPPGMLQDDDRGLSRWLASTPNARQESREAATEAEVRAVIARAGFDPAATAWSGGIEEMRHVIAAAAPESPQPLAPPDTGNVGAELEEMRQRKDAAYLERNQVVAALAKCFPSGVSRTAIEGWSEDWHGCVYIDLPTGQASWHYHDSQAYLFAGLPNYHGSWDGHDTPEKYRRLAALPVPEKCTSDNPQTCWRVRCNLGNTCFAASPLPGRGMVPMTELEALRDLLDLVVLPNRKRIGAEIGSPADLAITKAKKVAEGVMAACHRSHGIKEGS